MVGQGQRDAVAECARRYAVAVSEQDGALALVAERVGIDAAELVDQAALAMEVDGIAVGVPEAIDAHRRAAAGLLGEVARLAPLERLGQPSHSVGAACGLE